MLPSFRPVNLIFLFAMSQTSIARVSSLVAILGCRSMADTMPSGSRSNLPNRESTGDQNVELEDDIDEDPADVPEEELEAEVDGFLQRVCVS